MEYPKFSRTDQYEQVAIGISDGSIKDSYGNDIPVLKWRTIDGHKFFEIEKLKPQKEGQFLMQPLFVDSNRFIVDVTEITKYTTEKNILTKTNIYGASQIYGNNVFDYSCSSTEIGVLFSWKLEYFLNGFFYDASSLCEFIFKGSSARIILSDISKQELFRLSVVSSKNGFTSNETLFYINVLPSSITPPIFEISSLATVNSEVEFIFGSNDDNVYDYIYCNGGLIRNKTFYAPNEAGIYEFIYYSVHNDGRISNFNKKSITVYGSDTIIEPPVFDIKSTMLRDEYVTYSLNLQTPNDDYLPKIYATAGIFENDYFIAPSIAGVYEIFFYTKDSRSSNTSVILRKEITVLNS